MWHPWEQFVPLFLADYFFITLPLLTNMVRGPYVQLTEEMLLAISAKLERHPAVLAGRLKRSFGIGLRTAYRLKAEFADLEPNAACQARKKRGRRATSRPLLDAKIRAVLFIDCSLSLNELPR